MSSQARKLFSLKTILDFLAFFAFIILNMLYSKYYFLCVFIEISISLNLCNFFPAFFLFRSVIVTIIFVHLLVHYEFFISIFTPFLLLLLCLLICGISLGRQGISHLLRFQTKQNKICLMFKVAFASMCWSRRTQTKKQVKTIEKKNIQT